MAGTPGGSGVLPGRERTLALAAKVCGTGVKHAGGTVRARSVVCDALLPWALGQHDPLGPA